MPSRRIFLTGASGNVGSAVLAELVRRGFDVVALVRRSLPVQEGYRPVFGDLSDIRPLAGEVMKADGIIHCASPRTDQRQQALRQDIEGTAELLDLWQRGAFVFSSSQTVYGIPNKVLEEGDPVSAGGWYDIAKICNEQQVQLRGGSEGRGAGVSLRLPLIFASGPRRRDRQFLPGIFDALLAGKTFLFGSEEAMETFGSVYIGMTDVARVHVDALELRESGPYNVAGGFCTWKDLIEALGSQAGIAPKFAVRPNPVAGRDEYRLPQSRSFYDCRKFDSATGFTPSEGLDAIVAQFLSSELVRSA